MKKVQKDKLEINIRRKKNYYKNASKNPQYEGRSVFLICVYFYPL